MPYRQTNQFEKPYDELRGIPTVQFGPIGVSALGRSDSKYDFSDFRTRDELTGMNQADRWKVECVSDEKEDWRDDGETDVLVFRLCQGQGDSDQSGAE